LVSFVFDGGFAAEAGVDAVAVVEVFDPGGDPGVDLVAGGEGTRSARPSAQSAGVVVPRREEGAGFSQEFVLLLQFAHPPTGRRVCGFQFAWIRAPLTRGLTPLALECDPPAHHRFAQLSIPGHRRDSWTLYPTRDSPHHDDTPVSNDDEFSSQVPHWPQALTPA